MKIVAVRREVPALVLHAWMASTLLQRFRGLIARAPLKPNEGLLLVPCRSIHTFGMRTPLDIVFLDRHRRIVKCVSGLQPLRVAAALSARYTLELSVGTVARASLAIGQVLHWAE